MGKMILGAFETVDRADEALRRLEEEAFKPGGFGVVAPEGMRGDGTKRSEAAEPDGRLGQLLEFASEAPSLAVANAYVAASGPLTKYLAGRTAGMEGLAGAVRDLGGQEDNAKTFERTIQNYGVILTIAAENEERASTAYDILDAAGAVAVENLDIPAHP